MSIFSWFFSKTASPKSSELSSHDTKVISSILSLNPTTPDSLAELKQQRHLRREQLYDVVRNAMLRSKVDAAHYKFKVLSLDTRGRQFLVMVDLLGDTVLPSERWATVEQLVTTMAQQRDLQVKAVYWRLMTSAATDATPLPIATPVATPVATPAVPTTHVAATPVLPAVSAAVPTPRRGNFDPIQSDEVLAFKRAIADAMPDDDALAPRAGEVLTSGPRHPEPPSPAYQDTQLLEPEDGGSPLSRTQFGGL